MLLDPIVASCFVISIVALMMSIIALSVTMSVGDKLRYYRLKYRDLLIAQNNKIAKLRVELNKHTKGE